MGMERQSQEDMPDLMVVVMGKADTQSQGSSSDLYLPDGRDFQNGDHVSYSVDSIS